MYVVVATPCGEEIRHGRIVSRHRLANRAYEAQQNTPFSTVRVVDGDSHREMTPEERESFSDDIE